MRNGGPRRDHVILPRKMIGTSSPKDRNLSTFLLAGAYLAARRFRMQGSATLALGYGALQKAKWAVGSDQGSSFFFFAPPTQKHSGGLGIFLGGGCVTHETDLTVDF